MFYLEMYLHLGHHHFFQQFCCIRLSQYFQILQIINAQKSGQILFYLYFHFLNQHDIKQRLLQLELMFLDVRLHESHLLDHILRIIFFFEKMLLDLLQRSSLLICIFSFIDFDYANITEIL